MIRTQLTAIVTTTSSRVSVASKHLVFTLFAAALAPCLAFADEHSIHDWQRVQALPQAVRAWVLPQDGTLTEVLVARVTTERLRAVVPSVLNEYRLERKEALDRCRSDSTGVLVASGRNVDFERLCAVWSRDAIREVHTRQKGRPWSSVAVGTALGAGAGALACGVAPQASGSAGGCLLSTAGLGALLGWLTHAVRRGKRTLIYQADEPFQAGRRRDYEEAFSRNFFERQWRAERKPPARLERW